jgi:hypothetical protein
MKHIFKIFITAAVILFFTACHKVDDLPLYTNGSAITLSSSVAAVAAAPADSSNKVLALSWTNPKYAQDSSLYKFVIEIDSTGRGFAKEYTKTIVGKFSDTMTAKELNVILLGFGFAFNTQYTIDVRVTSSYGNNNEQYLSNTIQLQVTPYKVPPKIVPPAHLYIVGNATAGGWNNPVPVPTQELALVDETTFMGVFDMSGGNQYLLLPVNGDWSHKYAVGDNVPASGGDFGYDAANNFTGPTSGGFYLLVVDFQHGTFSLTPYTGPLLPTNLFMVGSATPGGWNNPVPVPSQQFTRLNSVQFQLTLAINASSEYLFLPVNGDWSHKYAVADNSIPGLSAGGFFGYDFSSNFPGPALAGNYKIEVNFAIKNPAAPTAQVAWFKTTKL